MVEKDSLFSGGAGQPVQWWRRTACLVVEKGSLFSGGEGQPV